MPDGIPSPNPDFPQQIKNVTGQANVKIQNKNLFDKDNATTVVGYFSGDGSINYGGSSTITTSYSEIKPNTNMIVSGCPIEAICFYDKNKNFIEKSFISANVSFNKNAYFIRLQAPTNTFDINKLQIEEGSTATSYVPHQEQNYPFTFAEGQRGMQGTQLKDDGIHNIMKRYVITGNENWGMFNNSCVRIEKNDVKGNEISVVGNIKCNYLIGNSQDILQLGNVDYGISTRTRPIKGIVIRNKECTTLEEYIQWFKQLYNNGTPVIVEYELADSELESNIIPYNETQQAQYNAKKEATSYDDMTYITSESDELGFNMNVVAVADANKVIDSELQEIKSAVIALGGDINV